MQLFNDDTLLPSGLKLESTLSKLGIDMQKTLL